MRRSLRPLVFPTALAGAALVWSAIAQADQVGIQVVSQDVSVDTSNADLTSDAASDILYRNGGHSSARTKMTSRM